MYKQIIIVRKDLNMSHGKMAAQVSHVSMAFLTSQLKKYYELPNKCDYDEEGNQYKWKEQNYLKCSCFIEEDVFDNWINSSFTKCVLQAKNKNLLLKAKFMAEELNMKEGKDFFLTYDNCYTELTPEEDNGGTLTCIGFKPMDSNIIDKIGKKYHLYI